MFALIAGTLIQAGYPPADLELSKGEFLVATEKLADPSFAETVVLLAHYDKEGALGLVINDPTKMNLSEAFPDISALKRLKQQVYLGGPVERSKVFLLIRSMNDVEESVRLFDHVYFSTSKKVLEERAPVSNASESLRVFAGYCGWGAGQLEMEIQRGGWFVWNADAEMIFDKPAKEIWPEMIRRTSIIQARWMKNTTR
jgi:putative transcriptional regulator